MGVTRRKFFGLAGAAAAAVASPGCLLALADPPVALVVEPAQGMIVLWREGIYRDGVKISRELNLSPDVLDKYVARLSYDLYFHNLPVPDGC